MSDQESTADHPPTRAVEADTTLTVEELIKTWGRSTGLMHIAHHVAASRYAKWHRWLGCTAAVLAAIVGTSIFASLSQSDATISPTVLVVTGLLSILSAALIGALTFLDLDQRARRHLDAAADFQRLRREMEEEETRLARGRSRENYDSFKDQWHQVLKASPPLPQGIHDRVKAEYADKHGE